MYLLYGNRLIRAPAPTPYQGCVLMRVEHALIGPSAGGTQAVVRTLSKYPKALQKLARFLLLEGPKAVWAKGRTKLESYKLEFEDVFCSVSGTVVEASASVAGLKAGDKVACVGFNYPAYADYLLFPGEWCTKIPGEDLDRRKMAEAAYILPGCMALDAVDWLLRPKEPKSLLIVGDTLVSRIAARYAASRGYVPYIYYPEGRARQDDKHRSDTVIVSRLELEGKLDRYTAVLFTSAQAFRQIGDLAVYRVALASLSYEDIEPTRAEDAQSWRLPKGVEHNLSPYSDMPVYVPPWLISGKGESFVSAMLQGTFGHHLPTRSITTRSYLTSPPESLRGPFLLEADLPGDASKLLVTGAE